MIALESTATALVELGGVLLVLAVAGRAAARVGLPAIPLYLAAGLLLGKGGAVPLGPSVEFIEVGAQIGVVMLLLLLGLEYHPTELQHGLRTGWRAGVVDVVLSAAPGVAAGFLLGWGAPAAALLGGVTYVSSSGIIAKQLDDLDRLANRETPTILSLLVIEDLVMAAYLPLMGIVLVGSGALEGAVSVLGAIGLVAVALMVSHRAGDAISRFLDTESAELLLLTVLGVTLLIAGLSEQVHVSAAVGAFLVGVTLSGQVAERGRELLVPLRDVFGGLFFVFFGLQVDPSSLPPVALPASILAVAGIATKAWTGWWAAGHAGVRPRGRIRAAASLVPRGEFSIVIAGLGVTAGVETDLGPLAACYVLIVAVVGSIAMRFADQIPVPGTARRAVRVPA